MKKFGTTLFLSLWITAFLNGEFFLEREPGKGKLTFTQKGVAKTIELGKSQGNFGMGLVYKGETLEGDIAKELKGKILLQINFGTFDVNTSKENAQFAAFSFFDSVLPKTPTAFSLSRTRPIQFLRTGFMEFHLPFTTPPTPEQRLQNSFYAKIGKVKIAPIGIETTTPVVVNQKSYELKTQAYQLDIDCLLTSPYAEAQGPSLKGKVEIPVFSPRGKAEEALFAQLAKKSSPNNHAH